MRTRRVARILVVFAIVMAVAWVCAFVATGHEYAGFRILAVLPAAVGITLYRLVPKPAPIATAEAAPAAQGARAPAPVDIVDR